ncbi:MAG: tetratricopeptide repeat protein [Dehalococcoidia bacterium]|nr:tetratricopeptide repeat protein [Dehalococcoidia bacterium]
MEHYELDPRDEAIQAFHEAVSGPADEVPLARAALLISRCEYPGLDVDVHERRLQDIADTLAQRLARDAERRPSPLRVVQTINQLLYRELGFHGDNQHYDDPRNLYLSHVLSERAGIPVTLAIVYAEVAQRAGLDIRIVGLPGHIVCLYRPEGGGEADEMYLDVFNGGRVLTVRDCQVMVRNIFGAKVPFKPYYLAGLTPRQVLQRLLHNLKAGHLQRGDEERAALAIDLLLGMFPWDLDEIRDRGMLRERLGEYPLALDDLEQYVQYRAGARDIQTVAETVRSLRRHTDSEA